MASPAVESQGIWSRVILIGASVTAGFDAGAPFGGPRTPQHALWRHVDASVAVPHPPLQSLADQFIFGDVEKIGKDQVEQAATLEPTVLIAADYLFWYCYGSGKTEEERLARFDRGLALLERFTCPLIVGDLPDASAATGAILRREQVPAPETLAAANAKLAAWVKGRSNVAILPLAAFMQAVMTNGSLRIGSREWPEGQSRVLLQRDNLHPGRRGTAALALAVGECLRKLIPSLPTEDLRTDPDEIYKLVTGEAPKAP